MVPKRYFLHASGFDQYDSAAQCRRFVREVARFAATWNVKAQVSAIHRGGAPDSHWTVTTQAPDWQVVTVFELLDWSDIVRGELRRPSELATHDVAPVEQLEHRDDLPVRCLRRHGPVTVRGATPVNRGNLRFDVPSRGKSGHFSHEAPALGC